MIQQLLPLMPKDLGTFALAAAWLGVALGLALWLFGSRFSRTLISLVLVSAGAWVGMFLPRWFHWSIEGWATAVGLALVLGVTGFLLHRFWVGLGLGVVAALWAAVVTWVLCHGETAWAWPKIGFTTQAWPYVQSIWAGLPGGVQKYLPYSCAAAFLGGACTAMLWPRFGVVTLYSAAGVSTVVGLGLCAVNFTRPAWVGMIPAKTSTQAMTLVGLVAFGALLQWKIGPKGKGAVKGPAKPRKPMVVDPR